LSAAAPPSKRTYSYKSAGGCSIQADVYRPEGEGACPAILWIHGGALILGHRGDLRSEQLSRYLEAGFAVVSIDYRLAPETKLATILEDVRDGHNWLREKGPELFRIDPDRIAVVGHSAGGYLTLTCGYRLRHRPRALVAFYGYGDIAGPWYSEPDPFYLRQPAVSKEEALGAVGTATVCEAPRPNRRGRFYLYCRQQGVWPKEVTGYDPHAQPAAFDRFCPDRNVSTEFPPTLLLHGDNDTDVPFSLSEKMAGELARHRVEHRLIRIPGGTHGFDTAMTEPRVSQAFDTVIAFLRRHLK
jgi:acetyl esterase/lipase